MSAWVDSDYDSDYDYSSILSETAIPSPHKREKKGKMPKRIERTAFVIYSFPDDKFISFKEYSESGCVCPWKERYDKLKSAKMYTTFPTQYWPSLTSAEWILEYLLAVEQKDCAIYQIYIDRIPKRTRGERVELVKSDD